MVGAARIPRRRGGLCGLLLVLLGAWGGLIPFIGPYFSFAFTPDKAWAYTSGRLYLSVLPGVLVLASGLVVLATRSRAAGILAAVLAAVGGAWFIVGYGVILQITHKMTINPGVPVGGSAAGRAGVAGIPALRAFWVTLGFFSGLGIVIIFVAALAAGRLSLLAARDVPAPVAGGYPPPQRVPENRTQAAATAVTVTSPIPVTSAVPVATAVPVTTAAADTSAGSVPAAESGAVTGQESRDSTQEFPAAAADQGGASPVPQGGASPVPQGGGATAAGSREVPASQNFPPSS